MFYVYEYWDICKDEPFYVGKGTNERCYEHIKEAKRNNKTGNQHKLNRIRAILQTGKEPDIRIVYEHTDEQTVYDEEERRILMYGRRDLETGPLTNLNNGGRGGTSPSAETRKKISDGRKGFTHSEETRLKISEAGKQRTHTEETKQKMSQSHKGKVFSEETKQKMSDAKKDYIPWNAGKKLGSEYKTAGSFAKGNKPWNKGQEHMTGDKNPMFGKTHNDSIKEKIRKAATGRKRVYRDDGSYYMVKGETA